MTSWTTGSRHRFILVALVCVALLIRVERARHGGFWLDEALSWRMTEFDIGELFSRVAQDKHSPFYFLLLKAWIGVFGPSVFTVRMLSVVLGVVTTVAIYACILESEPTSPKYQLGALMGALLITIAPFQIYASQLARMYTLAATLTALSTWALFRALARTKQPTGRRAWALYAVFASLLPYAHYFAGFVLIAQAIVIVRELAEQAGGIRALARSRLWRAPAAVALVVAVTGLPGLVVLLGQAQAGAWLPPLSLGQWVGTLSSCLFQTALAPISSMVVPSGPAYYLELAGCLGAVVALVAAATTRSKPLSHLAIIGAVPILLMTLVSLVGENVFVYRYLIIPQVAVLATLAVAICLIRRRWVSVLVASGAVLVLGRGMFSLLPLLPPVPDAVRIMAECDAARGGSDAPVVAGPFYYFPLHYLARSDSTLLLYGKAGTIPRHLGANVVTPHDQIVSLEALSKWRRVIVVRDGIVSTNENRSGPDAAPPRWRIVDERRVTSSESAWVTVTTYDTATN
jgi:mannosyltransferase